MRSPHRPRLRGRRPVAVPGPHPDQLHLLRPDRVAIDFRLRGGKGSLTIGRERKRLSYAGVVHGSERLSEARLAKVLAASGDRVTWLQSDSAFGS